MKYYLIECIDKETKKVYDYKYNSNKGRMLNDIKNLKKDDLVNEQYKITYKIINI